MAEGLEDRLRVELMDYRDLAHSGWHFDRVVSVGMVEHVGRDNYGLFLDNAQAVLEDGRIVPSALHQRLAGASR